MNEEFANPTAKEYENAFYLFYRKATPEEWQRFIHINREKVAINPDESVQKEIIKQLISEGGNAGFFREKPNDDRMDYHHFSSESPKWVEFLGTYPGKHIGNIHAFRGGVEKTVKAVAAVVRRCQYDKFIDGETPTLLKVIEDRFNGRKFVGNFGDQMCLSRGTAFLIGKQLLLTAKHNLYDENVAIDDKELVYMFDYRYSDKGNPPNKDTIIAFEGKKIGEGDSTNDDWALVHLTSVKRGKEASVLEREPLKMSTKSDQPGRRLGCYSVGFSLGIPMKLSLVGHCTNKLLEDRFAVNLDLFHGNSGSPVLHFWNNKVIGLFVSGFPDLVEQKDNTIGLRKYQYDEITKNLGGEHCQLIGTIVPKIQNILQAQNLLHLLPKPLNQISNE